MKIEKIGNGKPEIAIAGCLHGDEIIGKKVIDELGKTKLLKGSLKLIIANEKAMKKKKRMIAQDLNRSFPGKKRGMYEEKLAYFLHKEIKSSDIVIDIHATNSCFDKLTIVTNLNKATKNILRMIPCKKVALLKKKGFGEGSMISHAKTGIAIEYGPNKEGKNYKKALKDILEMLGSLGIIRGNKKIFNKKELYTVNGAYAIHLNFKASKKIRNFKLIKKGEIIGNIGSKKVRSKDDFYPIFLGESSYKNTLAIMANKKRLNLS